MKKWRKLGLVYKPTGKLSWARSHAANPVAEHLRDDLYKIYFSTRDGKNRSSIGAIKIDLKQPDIVLEESQQPLLSPGKLGMFDDSGVSIGCVLSSQNKRYLYYMGWNLSVTVPWKNEIGLATSNDNGETFNRFSDFPVMRLNEIDPYTISYPWIIKKDDLYQMWYGSNLQWGKNKEDMKHVIKYAESEDGIHWTRKNEIAIGAKDANEYAICKPCVINIGNQYHMWFCSRGERYRIRYATSNDGKTWLRHGEQPALTVSDHGWDSDMVEYPCVFQHKEKLYMLFSGDGYGSAGFGIAVFD